MMEFSRLVCLHSGYNDVVSYVTLQMTMVMEMTAVRLFAEEQCCGDCALMPHEGASLDTRTEPHSGNGINFRPDPCPIRRHLPAQPLTSHKIPLYVPAKANAMRIRCKTDPCPRIGQSPLLAHSQKRWSSVHIV